MFVHDTLKAIVLIDFRSGFGGVRRQGVIR